MFWHKIQGNCVICLDWRERLYLCPILISVFLLGIACPEFRKRVPISASAAEDVTSFYDLCDFQYSPVVCGVSVIVQHENNGSQSCFCFGFAEIGRVAVYVEQYAALTVSQNGVWTSIHVIEEL